MVTYKQQQIAKYDKKQTIFTPEGIQKNPFIYAEIPITEELQGKTVLCPFCVTLMNFGEFRIVDLGLIECPKCKTKQRAKTVKYIYEEFQKETFPKMYAKWVYSYRLSGFFSKIDFKKFNQGLETLHIQREFWDEYKRLKGEYIEEEINETEKEEE